MSQLLPEGFADLEQFVETWSRPTGVERAELRGSASVEERKAFYAAASEKLDAALDYLDSKPLDSFDEKEQRLMHMMLSLAHVSIAEEIQKSDEERHAYFRTFMPVTRVPADF